MQDAGASVLVIEAVPSDVVDVVLPALEIPVIGIGAGPADGQVLVVHDVLGITEGRTASFVKRYATVGDDMVAGVAAYAREVREGVFPGAEHGYSASDEAVAAARAELAAD